MIALIGVIVLLSPATWTDVRSKKVPVIWLAAFGVAAIPTHLILRALPVPEILAPLSLLDMAAGIAAGLVVAAVSFLTKGKVGYGDAVMIAAAGAWTGGAVTAVSCIIASLTAGVFGLIVMLARRKTRDYRIPFAPFLLGSVVTVSVLGMVFG